MVRLISRWGPAATIRRLWPFIRPERRLLLAALAATAALTAIEVATPVVIGLLVDGLLLQLNRGRVTLLSTWEERALLAALLGGALLRGALLSRERALEGALAQKVTARIRKRVWTHVQRLPVSYANRRGPGRLLLRFIGDSRAVQRMVGRGLVRLTQDLMVAAGIIVVLAILNWRMSLAVLLLVPVQILIFGRLNPRLRKESRARRRRRSRLSAYLASRAAGFEVAKPALGGGAEMDRFNSANRGIAGRGARVAAISGRIQGLSAAAVALSSVLVLLIAVGEASAGRLTAGTMVTFYALIGLLAPVFTQLAIANRTFQEGEISVDRLMQTLAEPPETPAEGAPSLHVRDGALSVRGVSFAHPGEPPVLDGVSLEARRGEIVAIVGPEGAGKSTLLELLLRFESPDAGRIMVDGQDIAALDPDSLRACAGYVPQDAPLFDGTAAENVTIGARGEVSDEDLERAARTAGADEIVARLPDGWATPLAQGRRGLSYGERRRFALARALLGDPPILVLDDIGALLDGPDGGALAARLRDLAKTRTVVVAGGREPDALAVDRTYVLERGRMAVASAAGSEGDASMRSPSGQGDEPARRLQGPWVMRRNSG